MARRPRLFAPGLLYHVIVRGNQRQNTFTAAKDYGAYLERLVRYRNKYRVIVGAGIVLCRIMFTFCWKVLISR